MLSDYIFLDRETKLYIWSAFDARASQATITDGILCQILLVIVLSKKEFLWRLYLGDNLTKTTLA